MAVHLPFFAVLLRSDRQLGFCRSFFALSFTAVPLWRARIMSNTLESFSGGVLLFPAFLPAGWAVFHPIAGTMTMIETRNQSESEQM